VVKKWFTKRVSNSVPKAVGENSIYTASDKKWFTKRVSNSVPKAVGENSVYNASGKKVVHKASFKLSSKSGWGKLSLYYKW
jgi:hypothetical protein